MSLVKVAGPKLWLSGCCRMGPEPTRVHILGPAGFDERGHARDVVHGQVVEQNHVAGHERGAEHLREVGREAGPVQGPVQAHDGFQAVDRQGPDERAGGAHAQGNGRAYALPARGPDRSAGQRPGAAPFRSRTYQHPPDRAPAHALPALGLEKGLQLGQRGVGLPAHPGHELRLRRRVQAPSRPAVPRLGRHRAARALAPQ